MVQMESDVAQVQEDANRPTGPENSTISNMEHELTILEHIINCSADSYESSHDAEHCGGFTRYLSDSPHGSLLTNSIPLRGVPMGGKRTEASMHKKDTFNGRACKHSFFQGDLMA